MFREGKNKIESDEGFAIELLGREGIKYTEGTKKMTVYSEMLIGPQRMAIYKKSIKNWQNSDELIDSKKREEIVENIRRAFLFCGIEIRIDECL